MKNVDQSSNRSFKGSTSIGEPLAPKNKNTRYDSGFWQKILAGFELLIRFQIWQINSDPDLQY